MANGTSKLLDGKRTSPLVLVGGQNGVTVIPAPTPLTRLNYFDGKFLRADDLNTEQAYLRRLVELSNQSGGSGVAHGFDVSLGKGDTLDLGPGLAIDPAGRVLLLPAETTLDVQELIEKSRPLSRLTAKVTTSPATEFAECAVVSETPSAAIPQVAELYVLTIAHAEALCGAEDVYGKLCEEACVTSTDRPYRLEGLVVRVVPLVLQTPLMTSRAIALTRAHLRSRIASAYYADERGRASSLISGAGLRADVWCFGAAAATGSEVPIAVLARSGAMTAFLDAWIARRERIETPAKRYWHGRMAMRPWDVFVAQILQFQCQLHELLQQAPNPGGVDDPCREERQLLHDASETVAVLLKFYQEVSARFVSRTGAETPTLNPELLTLLKAGLGKGGETQVAAMYERLVATKKAVSLAAVQRLLLRGGIVELPSAGYLPVVPGTATINSQVRALLGEGVALRFCVVRPDFVPHALEEAQHMERISLLQGLDSPENKPEVDILVPNGEIVEFESAIPGRGFEVAVLATPTALTGLDGETNLVTDRATAFAAKASPLVLSGAGRSDLLDSGGAAFHFAGATQAAETPALFELARGYAALGNSTDRRHLEILRNAAASAEMKPVADTIAEFDPGMIAKLIGLSARALRYRATLRSAEQPFVKEDEAQSEGSRALRAFAPAQPTESRVINLWTTMQCADDPFSLVQGGKTPVVLRLVLALPGTRAIVEDFQLRGDFRIDRAAVTLGDERRMTGRFSGVASVKVSGGGIQNSERTTVLDLDASVRLKMPPGEAHVLELRLAYKKTVEFLVRATWSGQSLHAEVTVDYRLLTGFDAAPESLRLVDVRLKGNDQVLNVAHPLHTVSLSAIEVVGATLADTGFAAEATHLLFPPPPPVTEELIVRGTLDWVLFHRRRNKQCADLLEKPTPAPARRYQVYQVEAANTQVAGEIREALLRNNSTALARINFRAVGQVGFGSGAPTLTSDPETVRADWQRAHPGEVILYEAIATHGVGDGEALAIQRVLRLESVLADITPADDKAVHEVLPKVPDLLAVAGADGVIVVMTRSIATSCHSVYALIPGASLGRVLTEDGRIREEILAAQDLVKKLNGEVLFKKETAELTSESVLAAVTAAWNAHAPDGQVGRVVVVSRQGEATAAVAAYIAQAQTIVTALGASQVTPQSIESPVDLPGDCPAITLMTVQEVNRLGRVVVWRGEEEQRNVISSGRILTVEFAPNGALRSGLPQEVIDLLRQFGRYAGVEIAPQEDPPDARAEKRLDSMLDALGQVQLLAPTLSIRRVSRLRANERQLLSEGGITANELIFLRVG